MQTSKIIIGKSYAIERGGKPVKFNVTAIVTRKEKSVSASEIEGWFTTPSGNRESLTLKPEDILGEFEAYAELVAQEDRRTAEAQAVKDAKDKAAKRLAATFYRLSGLAKGNDYHREPFQTGYGGSVEIRQEAVEPLLKALEAIKESA